MSTPRCEPELKLRTPSGVMQHDQRHSNPPLGSRSDLGSRSNIGFCEIKRGTVKPFGKPKQSIIFLFRQRVQSFSLLDEEIHVDVHVTTIGRTRHHGRSDPADGSISLENQTKQQRRARGRLSCRHGNTASVITIRRCCGTYTAGCSPFRTFCRR